MKQDEENKQDENLKEKDKLCESNEELTEFDKFKDLTAKLLRIKQTEKESESSNKEKE